MSATTSNFQVDRVQAEWALGRFPIKDLPGFALQALRHGFRGPHILELADCPDPKEITDELVGDVLCEMGREPITVLQALLRLARGVAERVLREQIPPAMGAEEISLLLRRFDRQDVPVALAEFRWRADGTRQRLTDRQRIIELSWALLEEDPVEPRRISA